MAKSISEEELQLKKRARRRLIGAIALVTIVAVFLPMVLDHEPKPISQDVSIQIPSPNAGTFTSKIVPVTPGTKSSGKPASAPSVKREPSIPSGSSPTDTAPPAYDTEAAPPQAVREPSVTQPKLASKPPVKAAVEPTASARPKATDQTTQADIKAADSYVVQVAALNDADKARQMQEQIAAVGVKSYTEVVPTAKGSVTRVRAGPFASRGEAETVRDKLKDMGLNGNIVPK